MLDFLIPNNYCWLAISGHVFSPITQYKFLTIRIFFFWHSCHFQKLLILCFWLSVPPVSKDFKAKFHLSFRSMDQNHGVPRKKCEIEINYFWLIQISFGELFFLTLLLLLFFLLLRFCPFLWMKYNKVKNEKYLFWLRKLFPNNSSGNSQCQQYWCILYNSPHFWHSAVVSREGKSPINQSDRRFKRKRKFHFFL